MSVDLPALVSTEAVDLDYTLPVKMGGKECGKGNPADSFHKIEHRNQRLKAEAAEKKKKKKKKEIQFPKRTGGRSDLRASAAVGCLLQLVLLRISQNFSGPTGEVDLIVPNLSVLVEGDAGGGLIGTLAFLALGIPPRSLVLHPGPVGHPTEDVLPRSGALPPPPGVELHDAAVPVHQKQVRQLRSVGRSHDVRLAHQLHLHR
ncbi:GRAM [Musa troglodytarum]|uniref:GRAM n=1 Tax=Musa troglodytarum TaxID=320322 RepID=A0A9E7HN63_9LILI|nr:GRAM [Musa troglodytarum]